MSCILIYLCFLHWSQSDFASFWCPPLVVIWGFATFGSSFSFGSGMWGSVRFNTKHQVMWFCPVVLRLLGSALATALSCILNLLQTFQRGGRSRDPCCCSAISEGKSDFIFSQEQLGFSDECDLKFHSSSAGGEATSDPEFQDKKPKHLTLQAAEVADEDGTEICCCYL